MAIDIQMKQKSEKRFPKFANFGEYLFWSYANLQMLCAALNMGKAKYDKSCYDLLEFNVSKIKENNYCWYCGKEMEPSKLTKDHVFPRSKGGTNVMDNIIMVCKTCNSSKGNMDLFEWYATVRKEWPPLNILIHYLKNINLYSIENGLMDKHAEEMDAMELPFKWQYIPLDYPQPEVYM